MRRKTKLSKARPAWLTLLFSLLLVMLLSGCEQTKNEINSLDQLKGGKTFAVPTGTVADKMVLKHYPDAVIAYYNTVYDCGLAVLHGKADATVYDQPVLKNLAGKNPGTKVLEALLLPDLYGFAVRQEDHELKNAIDVTLNRIKSDGTYNKMIQRWLPDKGAPAAMPVIANEGQNGLLRFGTAAVTEPMSFVDANQELAGFDIEFAQRIAAGLNKKLEVVNMEFGAMLPALISGKVDFIGAGLSITEERAKKVLFSESYYQSGIAVLVRSSEDTPKPSPVSDKRKNTKVGVLMGSIHETYAQKTYVAGAVSTFNTVADMLMALDGGKVDGAFMDHTSVREVLATNPGFKVLDTNLFTVDIAAGFPKSSTVLLKQFNTFLATIKTNGIYDQMVGRWHENLSGNMPEIELPADGKVLKIGVVSDIGLPFATKNGDQWKGFDIELATRFAASAGMRPQWVDMPFGSLLPAIVSGKIEMITASMMITGERSKQINFSDPYFASGVSIIGRNDQWESAQNDVQPFRIDDGTKIGILMGSIYEKYVEEHYPKATVLLYNSLPDMFVSIGSGKTDMCFIGQSAVPGALRAQPGLTILKKNLYKVEVGAGFHRDNDRLREDFNEWLSNAKNDGTFAETEKRWFENTAAQLPEIESRSVNGTVRVGVCADIGLPFASHQNAQFTGFDIELALRFGAWAGKKVELVDMPFGSLLSALNSKKIDIILASLAITPERSKEIDFSDPYYASGVTILGRKENAAASGKMAVLEDISNKKVGIFTGTVHDAFMARTFPNAQTFRFENSADMILSLKSGKIDAAMFDRITAGLVLKRNNDLGLLTDDVLDMPLGVGFNKKDVALLEEFNSFLKEIKNDGTYEKMHRRWFVEDAETAVMPAFEPRPAGKKLTVGVSVEDLPYVAVMNGKYVGFDIEMMQAFASRKGYNLELVTIEFPALVAALSSGKVDMITDGIAISEERAKQINFSDEYALFRTSVIALRKNLAGWTGQEVVAEQKGFFKKLSESFYNNIMHESRYLMILRGLLITIIISVFSAIFGTLLGGLICWMRMSKSKVALRLASWYISLIRGTPVLVLLMIIYYVVFASVNLNPVVVAVIAFGINFAAYVSEMFRTGIEGVDKGQKEAGIALGFTKVQTFIHIIMPQALRQVLPVYKGEFVSLVKMTSIVGYIAVEDLTKASDIIRSRTFDAFFPLIMAAVIYILIAWLLTLVLDYVEISIDPKKRRLQIRKKSAL